MSRAAKCCHNSETFPLAQQPKAGQGRLILNICRSHTTTHHKQQDSSGLGIGPSQRSTWQHTALTRERHPVGFELAVPANVRPQTLALDRSATELGISDSSSHFNDNCKNHKFRSLVKPRLWCVPVTTAWRVLRLRMEERPPDVEDGCKNTE